MRLAWLLLVLLLASCRRDVPPGVLELLYASPYPPSHPFSLADQEWMRYVAERSNGTLRIVPNWSGALLSTEHAMPELRHGVADIGLITPIYVKGGAHLIRAQAGFYSGTTSMEQQVALYRCLAQSSEQFGRELLGLKVLAVQGGSLPGIITTERPIRGLADLAGLRLRAPTELLGVLRALDVDAVTMPMGEVYSALAKGMLDGVVAPLDTFRSLHFVEVARHYVDLHVPRGAYPARAIRLQRWQQLDRERQRVLEDSIPVWEAALARLTRVAQEQGEMLAVEAGVHFTSVSAEDQARFDALYLSEAARNARGLKKYGIDGSTVFELARASVIEDGDIRCTGGNI